MFVIQSETVGLTVQEKLIFIMVSIRNITPFVKETIILNCSPYKCEVIYDRFFFNDKSYFLIVAQREENSEANNVNPSNPVS